MKNKVHQSHASAGRSPAVAGRSLLPIAFVAVLIIGLFGRSACANQYDVAYPTVTSTNAGAGINIPAPGSNGAVQTVPGAVSNGAVVTSGSGLAVSPTGPIVSSTAGLATSGSLPGTTGTAPIIGQLGMSSSGTLIIYGTNGQWRNVP